MSGLRLLCDEHVGQKRLYPSIDAKFYTQHVAIKKRKLGPGTSDTEIWKYVCQNNLNVFTNDTDFITGDADPNNGTHPGILYYDEDATVSDITGALQKIEGVTSTTTIQNNDVVFRVPGNWL